MFQTFCIPLEIRKLFAVGLCHSFLVIGIIGEYLISYVEESSNLLFRESGASCCHHKEDGVMKRYEWDLVFMLNHLYGGISKMILEDPSWTKSQITITQFIILGCYRQ